MTASAVNAVTAKAAGKVEVTTHSTDSGVTLDATALQDATKLTVAGTVEATAASTASLQGIMEISAGSTLNVSDYTTQDFSGIDSVNGTVNVSISSGQATTTISDNKLASADSLTVASGQDLIITTDSTLLDLDSISLAGGDSDLTFNAGSFDNDHLDSLIKITGADSGTQKLIVKADMTQSDTSTIQTIDLGNIASLAEADGSKAIDKVVLDFNDSVVNSSGTVTTQNNTPRIAVKLSRALTESGVTEITLDQQHTDVFTANGTPDTIFFQTKITEYGVNNVDGNGKYNAMGVEVKNFDTRFDSVNIIDSATGQEMFSNRYSGIGQNGTISDGVIYFDANAIGDFTSSSFVRDLIAAEITSITQQNIDFGVVVFNDAASGSFSTYDAALFQVRYTGSASTGSPINPSADDSNLLVAPVAVFRDINDQNFSASRSNRFTTSSTTLAATGLA